MKLLKWLSVTDRFYKIYLDKQLAPFGINNSQYMFLIKICRSPGILQDSLMDMFYVHSSNIVRTVAALEKQGMIMRSPNDKDKRTCKLYPTERALSVIDEVQTVCEKTEALLLQGFRESDKNLFIDLLIQAGENPLGYEKISKLLKDFAIPSIMASLVGSIYNIVDQIFIGQGVGYLGNAATNVAYPFSTICLAIALLVGIGSASRVSLCLGRKEPKAAAKAAGNGIVLMGIFGIIYLLVGEAFLSLLLKAFGATTDVFPYAKQYASITLIGMPFLIVTNGMSNLIRADGKPKYSMVCMVMGAIINTILDPIFIFACDWGIAGAAWATVIGQIFSFILALRYLWRFQTIHFEKESCFFVIK